MFMKNLLLTVSLFVSIVQFSAAQCDTCAYIICTDNLVMNDPRCNDSELPVIADVRIALPTGDTLSLNQQFGFRFPYSQEPVKEDELAGLKMLATDLTGWLGIAGRAEVGFDFPGLTLPPCRSGAYLVIYSRVAEFTDVTLRSSRGFCTASSAFSSDCESQAQTCSYRLTTPQVCSKEDAIISLDEVWICGATQEIRLSQLPGFRFPYQYQYGSLDYTYKGLRLFRRDLNAFFKQNPEYVGWCRLLTNVDDPGQAWIFVRNTNLEILRAEISSSESSCPQNGVFDVTDCQ